MKAVRIFVIPALFIALWSGCRKSTSGPALNPAPLIHVGTTYGGCNGQRDVGVPKRESIFRNDTVSYSVRRDTLRVFIGLNYICCAPFTLQQRQEKNILTVTLADTCNEPYSSCYCRCMCYYEFEAAFSNFNPGGDPLLLRVFLRDPRQQSDSLLHHMQIQ